MKGEKEESQEGAAIGRARDPGKPASDDMSTGRDLPFGERRVATVLFADLAGYSRLTEQLDPEDVVGVMNRIFTGATQIIEAHGGTVNQFSGDDVKALFGVPVAHDNDPRRAVTAALELHQLVRTVDTELDRLGRRRLALHTAICTGVIVTQVRDKREGLFGVTGDTINTAARLVGVAEADEILVDGETHHAIVRYFAMEPLGSVPLRGKECPVKAFRVLGSIPRGLFEDMREQAVGAYCGREREHAELDECLQNARLGHGRWIAVVGEPGVGKSRFLFEARARVPDDVRVVLTACDATAIPPPFQPFLRLLRELLDIRDTDAPSVQRNSAAAALREIDAALAEHLPLYLQLLSLQTDDYPLPPQLRDDLLREAMIRSLVALCTAVARRQPLVVLLEDWHWADESSTAALEQLAATVANHALMVVTTYRPEGEPPWRGPHPWRLHLRPLDASESRVVIVSRLGAVSDETVRRLHGWTGGNPLFLEEICRSLVDKASATGLDLAFDALEVPPTVQAVIRARIDRLDAPERELLRLASVLGERFALRVLATVAAQSERAVATILARLEAQELVSEVPDSGSSDATYRFKHAITRDVAYESILRRRRRDLHRRVGQSIEAGSSADRLSEHYEVLTEHYERGEDFERAALFAGRAGDKAAASFSLGAARTQYRRAIELLDRLASDPDQLRQRVDLSAKWAAVTVYQPAEARQDVLRASYEIAERLGYLRGAARAIYWMGWFEHTFGNHRTAVQHFERALELAQAAADHRLISQLHTNLGQSFYHEAEFGLATDHLSRAIHLRREGGSSGRTIVIANALGYLALVDAERGDFATARTRVGEALAIVRELRQRQLEGSILTIVAWVDLFQGEWDACIRRSKEMRAIADAIEAPYIDAMSRTTEGYALVCGRGDPVGLNRLREAVTAFEKSGGLSLSVKCSCLAEALAFGGRVDEAVSVAHRALARAEVGDRIGEIQAHRALGIARMRGPEPQLAEARAHLETGVKLAEVRGAMRETAVTRLQLAEVLARDGDAEAAHSVLAQATAALRTFAMHWYVAQADKLERMLESR